MLVTAHFACPPGALKEPCKPLETIVCAPICGRDMRLRGKTARHDFAMHNRERVIDLRHRWLSPASTL
jgi:hypothetical protein